MEEISYHVSKQNDMDYVFILKNVLLLMKEEIQTLSKKTLHEHPLKGSIKQVNLLLSKVFQRDASVQKTSSKNQYMVAHATSPNMMIGFMFANISACTNTMDISIWTMFMHKEYRLSAIAKSNQQVNQYLLQIWISLFKYILNLPITSYHFHLRHAKCTQKYKSTWLYLYNAAINIITGDTNYKITLKSSTLELFIDKQFRVK